MSMATSSRRRPTTPYAGLPAVSTQPNITPNMVGQILHGFNATKPSEQALQQEIQSLRTQLLVARSEQASTQCALAKFEAGQQYTQAAITSLRRGCMVRDMHNMSGDFMHEEGMTGFAGYEARAAELVDVVASMHDQTVDNGVAQDMQTTESAESLYSTTADCKWLRGLLNTSTYDIWQN